MTKLYHTPPEKYYEACVTYHLITYFKMLYRKTVYPFSISQVREKAVGFDFGYEVQKGTVFLLQYKRPIGEGAQGYFWEIERTQAEVLAGMPVRSYYVLPAFVQTAEWYEGLEKTYFIPTQRIWRWLQKKPEKRARLHQCEPLVTDADPRCFDPYGTELHCAAYTEEIPYGKGMVQLPEYVEHGICGYWIGDV